MGCSLFRVGSRKSWNFGVRDGRLSHVSHKLCLATKRDAIEGSRRSMNILIGVSFFSGGVMNFGPGSRPVLAAQTYPTTAEEVLMNPRFPEQWPFTPESFQRYDETSDSDFYESPRFVTHIDDSAIKALTGFYQETFPPSGMAGTAILDICSSWISHYPVDYTADRIAGLGMNEEELRRNKVLTEYVVKDLNLNPSLPYEDASFDVVTNAVSVDYLTKPLEVMREINRVLKPGGLAIMSFSNRCFPTKAIGIWTGTGDLDHIWIVGAYFHYAGGFEAPMAKDITKKGILGQKGDPMYVVYARKQNMDL